MTMGALFCFGTFALCQSNRISSEALKPESQSKAWRMSTDPLGRSYTLPALPERSADSHLDMQNEKEMSL